MLDDMDLKVKVALAGVTLVTIYFLYKSRQKKYNLPPGPTPLPVLGNLLAYGKQPFPFLYFMELGKQYGDVFRIYLGPQCMVVLNTVDVIREAYLKKGVDFANRPATVSAELFGGDKTIAMGQFTPEWKIQRKISHSALRKYATGEPLELLLQESFGDFCKLVDQEDGKPFDPYPKLTLMIYNVIMSMVFGKRFEYEDKFFKYVSSSIDEANEKLGNGMFADVFPILKYLPSSTVTLFKSIIGKLTEFMKDTWQEHVANFDPDNLTDFVYQVIASKLEAEKEEGLDVVGQLTEEHYHMMLIDMFLAGTDTSRLTLCWVIGLCAKHPQIQVRMQQEIDDAIGRDQPVCLNHRPHLPYTEAVLHEAMRMYPIAPIGVPRATTCDTEIRGYDIPKGTWVAANIWALHHDPNEWEEPEKFKPERHLDENGTLAPKPNSFLPFSIGRRVCVGESFAKVELHLLTVMLFQRYTFLPPPGEDLKLEMTPGLMSIPKSFKVVANFRE